MSRKKTRRFAFVGIVDRNLRVIYIPLENSDFIEYWERDHIFEVYREGHMAVQVYGVYYGEMYARYPHQVRHRQRELENLHRVHHA